MFKNSTITFLIVLLLSGVIYSCDINKAEEVVLLRTDTFSGFTADHVERWVLISDLRGNVFDYQNTSDTEGVLEFRGHANGSIIVSELTVASFEQGNETRLQHHITSYIGVPTGSSYFVSEDDDNNGTPFPDPIGKAKITLNNYSESDDPWMAIGFSDGYNGYNSWLDYDTHSYDGSTFMADMNLREDPIDVFISTYRGLDPVYAWLRDVSVGKSVVVNFDDFRPMIPVSVNKPVDNAYIQGQSEPYKSGSGYFLSWSEYWRNSNHTDPAGSPTIGYIDGFEYYDVYAQIGPILCCTAHERTVYHKLGTSVPESLEFPDASFMLSDGNLFSLGYTFNQPYTQKSFFFSIDEDDNSFWWSIHAPEGLEIAVPKIPNEILAQYPYLNRSELPLQSCRFMENLDGYTYRDFVKDALEYNLNRPTFENLEYYFQFEGL